MESGLFLTVKGAVVRTSDQTGPSKVVVFAEKEEIADTIWSLLDHAIHQSSLSYKATPWTFWPHVIFKIGIPLFLPPAAHK